MKSEVVLRDLKMDVGLRDLKMDVVLRDLKMDVVLRDLKMDVFLRDLKTEVVHRGGLQNLFSCLDSWEGTLKILKMGAVEKILPAINVSPQGPLYNK